MAPAAPRLSAAVIAENESPVIRRCLESLSFCDEIVLVDGGSTDDTVAVASAVPGVRVIRHSSGQHGIHYNKNLAASETTGEWILSLDADEVVTPELAGEIRRVISSPGPPCYRIARRTYFLGRWIRHCGWWPGYVVRLWKRGHTEWPLEVHRVPDPAGRDGTGRAGTLETPLEHHSYTDLADWGRKVVHFSGCEAVEAHRRGERLSGAGLVYALSLRPALVFLRKLVLLSGWRDGVHGLLVCGSAACATWLRAARLWEIQVTGRFPSLGGRAGA